MIRFADKILATKEIASYDEMIDMTKIELNRLSKYGLDEINRLAVFETRLSEHQTYLTPGSPAFSYYSIMKPTDTAAAVGELGLLVTVTTQRLRST